MARILTRFRSAIFTGTAVLSLATQAYATEGAASPEGTDESGAGEIVVTAFKREEKLQNVPASITAVGGDILHTASIDGANDLVRVIPSLNITDQGPGQRRITLRGIRSAGDAQVGIYYDETPVAGPPGTTSDAGGSQADFKLFDLERIEVLRGPQGTLYGAGSVGGTLRLVMQKPKSIFEAITDVSVTTTKNGGTGYQLNAAVNIPILPDVLNMRAVYFRRDNAGWIDNPGLGLKGINAERSDGGRLLLRFTPSDWLTIDAGAHFLYTEGANSTWSPSAGQYNALNRSQLPYTDKQRLYSLTARAGIGFADLVVTTSYQDRDTVVTRDPTYLFLASKNSAVACGTHFTAATCATPAGLASFNSYIDSLTPAIYYQPQSVKDWTTEARLQSTASGPFRWTIGGFYEDRDADVLSEGRRTSAIDGSQIAGQAPLLQRTVIDRLKQKAAFGEASYDLLQGLTVTGGFRYYDYDKVVGGQTILGLDILRTRPLAFATYRTRDTGWLYKANISWKPTSNLLLYGQAATGFRPGGVNQVVGLAQALAYQPDKLTTYEAGIKATLAKGAIIVNLSGYTTDWSDMQVSINNGNFVYLGNAGAARVKGIELETTIQPIAGLTFNANLTLTSAKLTQDQVPDGISPAATTGRAGDRIPNIPQETISVAGQYDWSLTDDLRGLVRADLSYNGSAYGDFRPSSIAYRKLGDFTQVNARIGVHKPRWGIYLFVNNLFDVAGRTAAGTLLGAPIEAVTTNPPRTFGLNLTGAL